MHKVIQVIAAMFTRAPRVSEETIDTRVEPASNDAIPVSSIPKVIHDWNVPLTNDDLDRLRFYEQFDRNASPELKKDRPAYESARTRAWNNYQGK